MIFSKEDDEGMVFAARVDKAGPISVFKLATKDLEPLRQDALLLRDRRIFPQDVAIIQAAVFRKGDKLFSIERGEKGFFLDDPDSRFQQFLHRMKDTLVVRYLADPSLLDSPLFAVVKGAVELKLQEEGETSEVVVQFGTSCPDGRHGRISDQPRGIFIVGEDFMHEFDQLFKDL
jgi:hypothetical protein